MGVWEFSDGMLVNFLVTLFKIGKDYEFFLTDDGVLGEVGRANEDRARSGIVVKNRSCPRRVLSCVCCVRRFASACFGTTGKTDHREKAELTCAKIAGAYLLDSCCLMNGFISILGCHPSITAANENQQHCHDFA
jgi:hypothetical protein